jgi:indole-3-glycerol phosphate synthase
MTEVRTAGQDYLARKARAVRAARAGDAPIGPALERLLAAARGAPAAPSLRDAIARSERVALIAEFKRRSPSGGMLIDDAPPRAATAAAYAAAYAANGATAVSILTDGPDFGGSLEDLAAAAAAAPVPVLRKDFIVDAAGICEARLHGGSAALLIVGILDDRELTSMLQIAAAVGIDCVVEVHDEDELRRAVDAGATLVGVNNRDLRRLTTDLAVTDRLARLAPPGVVVVSESGIRTPADVVRVRDAGARAILVGDALLRTPSGRRDAAVRALAGIPLGAP